MWGNLQRGTEVWNWLGIESCSMMMIRGMAWRKGMVWAWRGLVEEMYKGGRPIKLGI